MKSIIHFICSPDPRIGYGVCALNLKKEFEDILPNNLFQIIISDPKNKVRFKKICEKLNANKDNYNFINIYLTNALDTKPLEVNLPG